MIYTTKFSVIIFVLFLFITSFQSKFLQQCGKIISCEQCIKNDCGWCHSLGKCLSGTAISDSNNICPYSMWETDDCSKAISCNLLSNKNGCQNNSDCRWCDRIGQCLNKTELFYFQCKAYQQQLTNNPDNRTYIYNSLTNPGGIYNFQIPTKKALKEKIKAKNLFKHLLYNNKNITQTNNKGNFTEYIKLFTKDKLIQYNITINETNAPSLLLFSNSSYIFNDSNNVNDSIKIPFPLSTINNTLLIFSKSNINGHGTEFSQLNSVNNNYSRCININRTYSSIQTNNFYLFESSNLSNLSYSNIITSNLLNTNGLQFNKIGYSFLVLNNMNKNAFFYSRKTKMNFNLNIHVNNTNKYNKIIEGNNVFMMLFEVENFIFSKKTEKKIFSISMDKNPIIEYSTRDVMKYNATHKRNPWGMLMISLENGSFNLTGKEKDILFPKNNSFSKKTSFIEFEVNNNTNLTKKKDSHINGKKKDKLKKTSNSTKMNNDTNPTNETNKIISIKNITNSYQILKTKIKQFYNLSHFNACDFSSPSLIKIKENNDKSNMTNTKVTFFLLHLPIYTKFSIVTFKDTINIIKSPYLPIAIPSLSQKILIKSNDVKSVIIYYNVIMSLPVKLNKFGLILSIDNIEIKESYVQVLNDNFISLKDVLIKKLEPGNHLIQLKYISSKDMEINLQNTDYDGLLLNIAVL